MLYLYNLTAISITRVVASKKGNMVWSLCSVVRKLQVRGQYATPNLALRINIGYISDKQVSGPLLYVVPVIPQTPQVRIKLY